MNRMRVLHVINGLGTGGAERSLAEMLPYWMHDGFDPVIVHFHRRTEGVHAQVEQLGVRMRLLGGRTIPERAVYLRRLIRDERPALIHTTIFESDVLARAAAAGTRVPVLTSLVNTTYDAIRLQDPNVSPAKLRLVQAIDGFTARHLTTWFHAITHAVRDSAVATLGIDAARITVIERGRDPVRLGVASSERRERARRVFDIPMDAEVILNVGRQEFSKGQGYLLQAADRVLGQRPRAICLIAGRAGNATTDLESLRGTLVNRERIRFLGHRADVPELLCAADVFAFPSLYEGLGGAVIEAMALGVPIVASRLPAIEEVVEEGRNAVLVEARAVNELAEAVGALLGDVERRLRFGAHGRRAFLERFTLQEIAERMASLFRHVSGLTRTPVTDRRA